MKDRQGIESLRATLLVRAKAFYRRADSLSGGTFSIVRDAIEQFGKARGSEAAASMAYYTLFSLFPLLLALVAAGSFFLDRQNVYQQVVDLVTQAFPISQNLIEENLQQVLKLRGAVGLFGLGVALWSATGVFTVLTRNINRAWTKAPPPRLSQEPSGGLGDRRLAGVALDRFPAEQHRTQRPVQLSGVIGQS